jgi:protein-tyrosine phosphatase
MFNLFKKKEKQVANNILPLLSIKTDMHSHILPGIDDGAKTVEESLALIKVLYNNGFRKFICTPHTYSEMYPNTVSTIEGAYNVLKPVVAQHYPDVELGYATEYFLDEKFDEKLEQNEKLITVFDNNILIEHSFVQPPVDITTKIFNIQMNGYNPIYAHPERYEFYMQNKKAYHKLYDAGCVFQINLLSLSGYYGKAPLELAKYLIENRLVKLVGSDIHHDRHIEAFQNFGANKHLIELLEQDVLLNNSI